jgi:hypothetical protein
MCLYDKKRFRLSLYPIKIYKVVTKDNHSPFLGEQLFKWNNTHMHNTPFRSVNGDNIMGNGFYHCFTSKETAERFLNNWLTPEKLELKLVSGWIPPFVRIGRNCYYKTEICSRILILNI